jgi:hypothetical protein
MCVGQVGGALDTVLQQWGNGLSLCSVLRKVRDVQGVTGRQIMAQQ